MAAQALSSDLVLSTLCSSGVAFSGEASSSVDFKLPVDQADAGLSSTVIAADRVSKLMQQFVGSIESKVLDAFKQATADVVDHLAKEAATRVVMAERKAFKLEQELIHVKQQALAMLLHIKQSTDFQIAETERECVYERKRADDAEGKLCTLQENTKRIKDDLKKKGAVLETMQKLREQEIQLSPSDDEEDGRNKKIKLDQPQLDMDNLLLFAGVACDDASKPCSSSMQDVPSKTCTAVKQSRCQSFGSLPLGNKLVAKSISINPLRNGEQQVQQCHDLHDKEAYVSTQEQALLNNLAPGTFSKEISFQLAEKQYFKGVDEQQMVLSSKGTRKNKSTLKRCMHDSKPTVDQIIKEADHHRIHPVDAQSLDVHSLFESTGADSDHICRFRVNVTDGQASELLLPVKLSFSSKKHTRSISNVSGVVVADDDQMSSVPCSGVPSLANGSKPVYEDPGTCLHTVIVQNRGRAMTHSSLQVDSSFLKEIALKDFKRHEINRTGQSSGNCEESFPKCRNESSTVHLNPDESETMEIEQALRCLSEGIELPGCNSMHFKLSGESAADRSSLSTSPNMDADSNISEHGVVDSKNSQDQVDTDFCGKRSWPYLPGTHDATTQQGQFNGHSKFAKKKDGGKVSSENPDISSDGTCIRKPRATQPKNQFSSNDPPARTKSNPKSPEAQKSLSLAVESSRDSRRLMQGARQLFLLAERKWR